MARDKVVERSSFQLLDVRLQLEAEERDLEPIIYAYSRFLDDNNEKRADGWIKIDAANSRILSDRQEWPLHPGIEFVEQLYPRFLERFYDAAARHAILHAGVVAPPDGNCVLLAAPAGHGKSTLTLELARRGWTFFSDDFAPLDLSSGEIAPFPRAVGIVPGSEATPQLFRDGISTTQRTLFGKQLVDPSCHDRVNVAELSDQRPVSHLFILTGNEGQAPTLEIVFDRAHDVEFRQRLSSLDGVLIVQESQEKTLTRMTLETDPRKATAQPLGELSTHPAVLYCSKRWSQREDYASPPSCQPLTRRHAAEAIGRELLNRRPGGALLRRFNDNPVEMLLELASTLRHTQCWSLQVGPLEATANIVEQKAAAFPRGYER
jgi:hypothetical protein